VGQAIRLLANRRKARKTLTGLFDRPDKVLIIHHSCESFYNRPDGSSPRITSIAVRNLESGQTYSFSIHQMAERKGIAIERVAEHYDELEKNMLSDFYAYAERHKDCTWLHWNMRDISYGFQAIAHRFQVLGGNPNDIPEDKRVDLSDLMHDLYGRGHIAHPHLECLVKKNGITDQDFLTGQDEAEAFRNGQYVALHRSTLRKVYVIDCIAELADSNALRTDAKMPCFMYPQFVAERLNEYWLFTLTVAVVGLISGIIQLIDFIWK